MGVKATRIVKKDDNSAHGSNYKSSLTFLTPSHTTRTSLTFSMPQGSKCAIGHICGRQLNSDFKKVEKCAHGLTLSLHKLWEIYYLEDLISHKRV